MQLSAIPDPTTLGLPPPPAGAVSDIAQSPTQSMWIIIGVLIALYWASKSK